MASPRCRRAIAIIPTRRTRSRRVARPMTLCRAAHRPRRLRRNTSSTSRTPDTRHLALGDAVRRIVRHRAPRHVTSTPRRGERARDDPSVAAVVAGTGEDEDASLQIIGKAIGDFCSGGGAGALHQRARWYSSGDGRRIPRCGLSPGYDSNEGTQSRYGVRPAPRILAIERLARNRRRRRTPHACRSAGS